MSFIVNENLEPTNNHAEQYLRPAVIWCKNYFGTHSNYGSDFVARIMSLVSEKCLDVCSQILLDYFSGQKSLVFANTT